MATVEAPPRLQVRLHEGPFVNEPMVDFGKEENSRKMRAAIEKVRGQLGREYDLIIGGRRVVEPNETAASFKRFCGGESSIRPRVNACVRYEHPLGAKLTGPHSGSLNELIAEFHHALRCPRPTN